LFFPLHSSSSRTCDFPGSEIHEQLPVPQLGNAYVPLCSASCSKAELYGSIKHGPVSTSKNLPVFAALQQTFCKHRFCRGWKLLKNEEREIFTSHCWILQKLKFKLVLPEHFALICDGFLFSYRACNMTLSCVIILSDEFITDHNKSNFMVS